MVCSGAVYHLCSDLGSVPPLEAEPPSCILMFTLLVLNFRFDVGLYFHIVFHVSIERVTFKTHPLRMWAVFMMQEKSLPSLLSGFMTPIKSSASRVRTAPETLCLACEY